MQSVSASWFAAIAAASLLYLPTGHGVQDVLPTVAAYCPAEQIEQIVEAELVENLPRAQDAQSEEES